MLHSAFLLHWPFPASEIQHDGTYNIEIILHRWWAVPGFLLTEASIPIIIFLTACFFFYFANSKFPSGHSDIKLRLVECCSDGCPSASFSHLHTWSLELNQWMSGSWSHLPWLFSLAGRPAFWTILLVSKLLPCQNYAGHWSDQDLCLDTNLVSVPLTTWLGFCAGMHFQFFTIYKVTNKSALLQEIGFCFTGYREQIDVKNAKCCNIS